MEFFFSSRRRHTRYWRDWSSDVCSSDLISTIFILLEAVCFLVFRISINFLPLLEIICFLVFLMSINLLPLLEIIFFLGFLISTIFLLVAASLIDTDFGSILSDVSSL